MIHFVEYKRQNILISRFFKHYFISIYFNINIRKKLYPRNYSRGILSEKFIYKKVEEMNKGTFFQILKGQIFNTINMVWTIPYSLNYMVTIWSGNEYLQYHFG